MLAHKYFPLLLIAGLSAGGCAVGYRSSPDSSPSAITYSDPVIQSEQRAYWSQVDADIVAPVQASDARPRASVDASIRNVRDAVNLDAAVDAYAAGMAIDSTSLALHQAYLSKVVDFDAPNLGVAAADRILATDPVNGLARAVRADSEARQGAMEDALTDISIAARHAPNDVFVQRTAGHLLAWLDNNPHPPKLPSNVGDSLRQSRGAIEKSPAFAEAYREATGYLRDELASGPTTAQASQPSRVALNPPDFIPYGGEDNRFNPAPPPPYGPYAGYEYPDAYAYPYAYYPDPYWSGWGSAWPWFGFGFVEFDFGHRHFHDRDFGDRFFGHNHGFGRGDIFAGGTGVGNFDNSPRIFGPGTGRNFSAGSAGFGRTGFSRSNFGSRTFGRAAPFSRGFGGGSRGGGGFRGGGSRGGGGGRR